jgi:hypothetical protein
MFNVLGMQYAFTYLAGGFAMENIMPNYDERFDQKSEVKEFCKLWKCTGFKAEYKCFACPILADLKIMAKELHMTGIEWDRKAAA